MTTTPTFSSRRAAAFAAAACLALLAASARVVAADVTATTTAPPPADASSSTPPSFFSRVARFLPRVARAPDARDAADAEEAAEIARLANRADQIPQRPPHNVTVEYRSRRELGELDGWLDARATWCAEQTDSSITTRRSRRVAAAVAHDIPPSIHPYRYGGPGGAGPDGMSIYTGSCGFGQVANHFVTAWHTDGGYDWGLTEKCGQCYEVMCVDGRTRGHDWSDLGPWAGCQEAGKKSVTVMISDSCPCHHPNQGNKRWCCGDATHLDLSYAAFDQIAERDRGVVDLKVRPGDCSKQGSVMHYE